LDGGYIKSVEQSLGGVLSRIRKSAGGRDVELLLATKTVTAETVNALSTSVGRLLIGENKAQELLEKYDALEKERLTIHFIGHLQTNKVRQIIDKVDMIHSVDRPELAREISKRAVAKGLVMPVLVEINVAAEPNKSGALPEEAEDFIKEISALPGLRVKGLMTMAPAGDLDAARSCFSGLRELRDKLIIRTGMPLSVLSCGMSGDFEVAVEEGSTLVRLGRIVFDPNYTSQ
jgi:pyridoxal phosphate enzyme (YggS family)